MKHWLISIENKKKELVLDDNDPKIIEILLRYIYNNTIPLVNWYLTVKKILQVADKYQFSELFDTCDSYLAQQFPFLLNGKKNGQMYPVIKTATVMED